MKFLLDQNLSPEITIVTDSGEKCSTIHVRDVGLSKAGDDEILDHARLNGFVVVSQDSDFTNLLYRGRATHPSLILLRDVQEVTAAEIGMLISANLGVVADDLVHGAIVSIMGDRLRVRLLPIGRSGEVGN